MPETPIVITRCVTSGEIAAPREPSSHLAVRREDYTFVTNNRTDFIALYAKEELHAGLVIIVPNVTPSLPRANGSCSESRWDALSNRVFATAITRYHP
jgi:hypothetical protein